MDMVKRITRMCRGEREREGEERRKAEKQEDEDRCT